MSGAVDAIRAFQAGQAAGQADKPVTACPHDLDAVTPQEQALARMWLRGYDKARPMPVDYTGAGPAKKPNTAAIRARAAKKTTGPKAGK